MPNQTRNSSKEVAHPLSILVTGTSTGIGLAIAEDLARRGHQVFASVRKKKDAERLRAISGEVIPVLFDVTDSNAIAESVSEVEKKRKKDRAFSIVNNAGIAVAGPLESVSINEFRRQFDVNVFGALEVTQVYLPLVRENKGRIVNMSSVSGIISSPFLGAYAASKFALEAMSDALRRELAADGIKVLLIEPGPIQTPIWDKGFSGPRPEVDARYDRALTKFEQYIQGTVKRAIPPERVATAVLRALTENDPPLRQVVASLTSRVELEISKRIPAKWVDRMIVSQLFR